MPTKTKSKVDSLMREQQKAHERVRKLEDEKLRLPGRIEEAARSVHDDRTKGDLTKLRDREVTLPAELWGARVSMLEASVELQRAQLESGQDLQKQAAEEREEAVAEFEIAKGRRDEAVSHHWGVASRQQSLQNQLRNTQRELGELESQGPPSS